MAVFEIASTRSSKRCRGRMTPGDCLVRMPVRMSTRTHVEVVAVVVAEQGGSNATTTILLDRACSRIAAQLSRGMLVITGHASERAMHAFFFI